MIVFLRDLVLLIIMTVMLLVLWEHYIITVNIGEVTVGILLSRCLCCVIILLSHIVVRVIHLMHPIYVPLL